MPAVRRDLFNEATPHERDLLDHDPLVEEVAGILQSERTPLTVMINGPWGAGKTSFLRALVRHIHTSNPAGRHMRRSATVWFDPWEHEDAPNIIVPFLSRLREVAYQDDDDRRGQYSAQEKSLLAELVWMLVPDEFQHLLPGGTVHPHTLRERFKHVFPLRRPRAMARRMLPFHDKPQEHLSARVRRQFVEYVRAILDKGYQRVVIFLDDLDRCQPKVMRKLLELVKVNLIGATRPDRRAMAGLDVVFVFAIDHQTLIRAVNEPESATPTADYARYLDKIFDLRISLPRVSNDDVQGLVRGLVESRHPDVKTYLTRPVGDGDPQRDTYLELLVQLVSDYEELRSARFLRRIINKLMVFSYVRDAEQAILGDRDIPLEPLEGESRLRAAARLVIAWHILGQAWMTTRTAALRDDGFGLLFLRGLWAKARTASDLPGMLEAARKHNLSLSGIHFLENEILSLLRTLDRQSPPDDTQTPGDDSPEGEEVTDEPPPPQPGDPELVAETAALADADGGGAHVPGSSGASPHPGSPPAADPALGLRNCKSITTALVRLDTHVRRIRR